MPSFALRIFAAAGLAILSLSAAAAPPRPQHVVVVIEENRSFKSMFGDAEVQYINQLAADGALFTQYFAITHPSEPNYQTLFSGGTHGVKDDSCPHNYQGPNLATSLKARRVSFAIYSEDLPQKGFEGCSSDNNLYRRKHNPVADYPSQADVNMPFTAFPDDYANLPVVAYVVPNMVDDMHDGTALQADNWLKDKLDGYVQWAMTHHSLLALTWDEDDGADNNRVMTVVVGQDVKPGQYGQRVSHYDLLRTLTDFYGAEPVGAAAQAQGLGNIWK